MEDIIQFLLIIGFIAIGIFRQVAKAKSKNEAENEIPMPIPVPPPFTDPSVIQKAPQKTNKKRNQFTPPIEEGVRTTHVPPISAPPQQTTETEPADRSEFAIDSPEEARRAIIWSEILQRKY